MSDEDEYTSSLLLFTETNLIYDDGGKTKYRPVTAAVGLRVFSAGISPLGPRDAERGALGAAPVRTPPADEVDHPVLGVFAAELSPFGAGHA